MRQRFLRLLICTICRLITCSSNSIWHILRPSFRIEIFLLTLRNIAVGVSPVLEYLVQRVFHYLMNLKNNMTMNRKSSNCFWRTNLSHMLMHIIPSHGPILAYTTIKRLHRRVYLDVLVELHGVEEDLVAAVARVGLGRVVVVVDVVRELELVREDLAALVAHAGGPGGIVDGTEVENGVVLSGMLGTCCAGSLPVKL